LATACTQFDLIVPLEDIGTLQLQRADGTPTAIPSLKESVPDPDQQRPGSDQQEAPLSSAADDRESLLERVLSSPGRAAGGRCGREPVPPLPPHRPRWVYCSSCGVPDVVASADGTFQCPACEAVLLLPAEGGVSCGTSRGHMLIRTVDDLQLYFHSGDSYASGEPAETLDSGSVFSTNHEEWSRMLSLAMVRGFNIIIWV
jgi:hypothetical protein